MEDVLAAVVTKQHEQVTTIVFIVPLLGVFWPIQ